MQGQNQLCYYTIKIDGIDIKKAKKLVFVAFAGKDGAMYRTVSFDTAESVSKYLSGLGYKPTSVKKMSVTLSRLKE